MERPRSISEKELNEMVITEIASLGNCFNVLMQNKRLVSEDLLVVVITSHILTEYLINKIIEEKCKKPKLILDGNNFTYNIKLELVYNMELIPDYLYNNLKLLNKLRNGYAHQLNPNPQIKSFYTFLSRDPELSLEPIEFIYDELKDQLSYHGFLQELCLSTFLNLGNHVEFKLGIPLPQNQWIKSK